MKDAKDKGEGRTGELAKNQRRDRLKLALRENLKRRKSQARGRSGQREECEHEHTHW